MAGRYADNPVVSSPFRDGVLYGRELRRTGDDDFFFRFHTITAQDRIDILPVVYYGDASLWWRICDANPEIIDWFWLTPGTKIRIPDVLG